MDKRCVGFIHAIGLASAIEAADTAVKSGNVNLLGFEFSGYDARIVVKVEGKVGAVKAAVAAAERATYKVNGTLRGCESTSIKARLGDGVYEHLVYNEQTIGTDLQIKSGKRPQGTGRKGKRAGVWNPVGKYIME